MCVYSIILMLLAAPVCLKSQLWGDLFTWAPGKQPSHEFHIPRTQSTTVKSSNNTLDRTSVYTSDILKDVIPLACPMDCSNRGICIKGQCHCEGKFGDVDCSVDLSLPPTVYGIPNRGMCDLQKSDCDHVSILGNIFVESEGLSCRISIFEIKLNGTRFHESNYTIVKGVRVSFAEVSCPILDFKSKHSEQLDGELDTVAVGYMIAIGYGRNNFSNRVSLVLFDSECVDCAKAGFNISCKKKEEFNIENLRCVRKSIPSTPNKIDSKKGWIIAVAVGSAVLFIIGLLLLGYQLQRKKRNKMKKETIEKPYQELCKMERNTENDDTVEKVYDQIADLSDTYSTIQDNAMRSNESKKSEDICVKLNTATNAETEGYSSLRIVVQDEPNTDYENPTSEVRIPQSETGNPYSKK